MNTALRNASFLALVLAAPIAALAQEGALQVVGLDGTTSELTLSAIAALPSREISVTSEKGEAATYGCAKLSDALDVALATSRPDLKGKDMLDGVIASATDGAEVLFTLAELDPAFGNAEVFLCNQKNHQGLSGNEAPLRIVVPGDKRHARWLRQVMKLRLVQVKPSPQS